MSFVLQREVQRVMCATLNCIPHRSSLSPNLHDVNRAPAKPFDSMNGIAASMLLNMTSSVRFEGSLNVDLNDITMNLVPFPQAGQER